jgi:hypothetical protein
VILSEISLETSEQFFFTNVASKQKKFRRSFPTTVTVQIRGLLSKMVVAELIILRCIFTQQKVQKFKTVVAWYKMFCAAVLVVLDAGPNARRRGVLGKSCGGSAHAWHLQAQRHGPQRQHAVSITPR